MTDPAGVEVSLDGIANDGNFTLDAGGTDNVGVGIDNVQGSTYADELLGGPGDDYLSGAEGDDVLVGNGGADTFNGADGNDRIEARDGVADRDIDCDNSSGTPGAADTAILDALDPAPRNCENVQRSGGGETGGGTTTPPPTTSTPPTTTTTTPAAPVGSAVTKVEETAERVKMPDVVGQSMDAANRSVLAKISGIDLDIQFQRGGCPAAKDGQVIRQRPSAGAPVSTYEGAGCLCASTCASPSVTSSPTAISPTSSAI